MATEDRLVIGLDSSTQSTKAIAWSSGGELIAETRADIPMNASVKEQFEQDPEDWWGTACSTLKSLCETIDPRRIDGLAISNQRETLGFFDDDLNAVHPAMVWLDNRALNEVGEVAKKIGADRFHAINGKPVDILPGYSRLLWLNKNRADVMQRCRKVCDVNTYLSAKLTGEWIASWASADPSGVFDIEKKQWSDEVLDAIGLTRQHFAETVAPGTLIGKVTEHAASQTGLPEGLKIYAGGGDGQCAGLGVNAVNNARVYLNLGTAIIVGVSAQTPNISMSWRTMTSPTGKGYFLEGVMRAGTYFMDWFVENYVEKNATPASHMKLQEMAQSIPIGTDGLLVCPFLSGCMNPFWDMNAKAAFFGVSPSHDAAHLYRGAMEGFTGEIARCIFEMQRRGLQIDEIVAVGGGANSPLWRQMLVDATDIPLTMSKSLEASSLGAGMIAAVGAGWFETFGEAAKAMSADGETY